MIVWLIICSVISVVFHAPLSFPIPVIPDHSCRRIRTRSLLHRRELRAVRTHPQRGHIVPATRLLFYTDGQNQVRKVSRPFDVVKRPVLSVSSRVHSACLTSLRFTVTAAAARPLALRTARQHCLEFSHRHSMTQIIK